MNLSLTPQWSAPVAPFRHTWEGVVNVDQFRWLVRRDLQDQLAQMQQEIGARHVRAVGIYDDELRVFRPSPQSFMGYAPKDPRTNWQITDYIIDSLLDRGLNPMFTTSFIPSAMASGPVTVFTTKGHTSPPSDWKQWEKFVRESVQHAVDRYSLAVVRQWYFEVWNEPNLFGSFWGGTQQDFFKLWEVTFGAIKSVDASLRIGGPSTARADWMAELMEFAHAQRCVPDYLTAHIYNNDSETGEALAPFHGPQEDRASKSPNFAIGVMRGVRALADQLGFQGELHWNEWGRSFHGIDPRREDASEAAFIVRLLDRVSQTAHQFAYWCVSDIYDQVGYGREAFHGGYGLLNLQGLRKPAYHAFELLSRLGDQRVPVTGAGLDDLTGAIATRKLNSSQILCYAYSHDDAPVRGTLEVSVALPADAGEVTLHRVDHLENNVVSRWRDLGAPAYLSRAETRQLRLVDPLHAALGAVRVEQCESGGVARFTLRTPGIALLEIARR